MKNIFLYCLFLLCFSNNIAFSAVFTVTNTNDSGSGSLRAAITSANITPGSPHSIVFNIPSTDPGYNMSQGTWRIAPSTGLPYITGSNITIDGTTQTLFAGNTNPDGPEIDLDGNHSTDYCFFIINGSNITIKGFIIRRFTYGIQISGSVSQNHLICSNYIGVNYNASDTSGCYIGIEILNSAGHTMIGGPNPEDRNIVSGNYHIGVRLLSSSNNTLYNNFIGLDRTGTYALPNYDGLSLEAVTQNNIIGGAEANMRNVISGNYAYGLPLIGQHTTNNIIKGNYIGTNSAGNAAVPNTYGILFDDGSRHNVIGGYNPGDGNVLSGNSGYGLFIYNLGTTENYIYGNFIGTDPTGTFAVPNGNGIVIDGVATKHIIDGNVISGNIQQGIVIHITGSNDHIITRNKIGTDINGTNAIANGSDGVRIAEGGQYNNIGIAPDSGNVIAFNGGNGVLIMTPADFCNSISGNSIHSNGILGIDLWPEGVTANDAGDTDTGPNAGMNFPIILSATYNSSTDETTITGMLDSPSPDNCIVELFLSDGDPTGHGEGSSYVGSLFPLPNGTFTHTFSAPFIINLLTATATDSCGNTSEFSANYLLPPPNSLPETPESHGFCVFPNPANDFLFITNSQNQIITAEIFSLNGQKVFTGEFTTQSLKIYTSNWLSGTYFLVCNGNLTEKFVVQH
jgi:hypothetical protein